MLAPECLYFPVREATEKREKLEAGDKLNIHCRNGQSTVVRQLRGVVKSSQSALKISQMKLDFSHDKEFYRCKNVSSIAAFLFSRDFLKTFLLQGALYLQTDVQDHNIDEFLVVVPDGRLVICMDQFNAGQFGLSECKKYDCGDGRVLFELNLKNALLSQDQAGAKQMAQWRSYLSNVEHVFTEPIIVSWQPNDRSICPSTIAKFFHENDVSVELIEPDVAFVERTLKQCPDFLSQENIADCLSRDVNDFDFEAIDNWLGGHLLKLPPDELASLSDAASLDYAGQSGPGQEAMLLDISGLFMPSDVDQVVKSIQNSLTVDGWAVITTFPSIDSLFLRHSNMKAKTLLSASQSLIIYKNVVFVRSKRK